MIANKNFSFIVSTAVLLISSIFLNAQQIKWSQQLQDNRKLQYMRIIGSDDNGFYILRSNISFESDRDRVSFRNRKYELSYYGNEMNLKMQQPLYAPKEGGKIIDVKMVNNKVLVVSS